MTPIRRLLTLGASLLLTLNMAAQGFGLHWIHHAQAEDGEQVWFRRTYTLAQRPQEALLNVASEGRYIIYVNGYVASADLFSSNPDGLIGIRQYDIRGLLKPGQNVVAVWYAPTQHTLRQLSATLTGHYEGGNSFTYHTDGSWLCRKANGRIAPDGSETVDGTQYMKTWKDAKIRLLDWQPAATVSDTLWPMARAEMLYRRAFHATRVLKRPHTADYGTRIVYHFGHAAQHAKGWIRVTLRRMHRGDTISVNGLRYICTGEQDEQACRRFTTGPVGTAVIQLPKGRSRRNIMSVEAICIDDDEQTHLTL